MTTHIGVPSAQEPVHASASPGAADPRSTRSRGKRTRALTMTLLLLPSILLLALTNIYPLAFAAVQSLHDGSLISWGDFVGLRNYALVLMDPAFWSSARFTLIFTVVGVFGSWAVGLALALLLRTKVPASGVFRVLLLLPWVVPVVVSATSWNWLVATPTSPVPALFEMLGLGSPLFLATPWLAQLTVCVFKVWISFPFMMIMMSSALASVDASVYEAARVDGAGRWQTFRLITLPIISRTVIVSWILMTIFCVNDFPTIYLLTGGGPVGATQSLVVLAFQTVFQNLQAGRGVAIAFMMTFVLILVSFLQFRQIRKGSDQ